MEEVSVNAHVVEVLASFHDVRCPLRLVDLHPTLAKELPFTQERKHLNSL